MGWGDPFTWAKDKATAAGRAAAEKVATGQEWVGQKSKETGQWLGQKRDEAVDYAARKRDEAIDYAAHKRDEAIDYAARKRDEALDYAARKRQEAADYAARKRDEAVQWGQQKKQQVGDWAVEQREAAKRSGREAMRTQSDRAYDWMGEKAEAKRVKDAAKRQKECFDANQKAGSPRQSCPVPAQNANQQHDGWMMAPQGPGKPCTRIPPGKDATAQAREKAKLSGSACCKGKRAAGQPTRDIIYVNGINTDMAAHCASLNAIAAQTCGRVVGVYNATDGFIGDAAQTSQDRRLIKQANSGRQVLTGDGRNPAVDTLQRQVTNELRAGRKPEVWAHSQGGAVTSLALHGTRNSIGAKSGGADPLAGMKVKSMGSAAPSWPNGPAYEHYVHVNDFTPSSFGLGFDPAGDAAAAGRGARVIRFAGDPKATTPFGKPTLDWKPAATANHGVEDTYLRMEKQVHGGCP